MNPYMHCRSCNHSKLTLLFSFGQMPLANHLVKEENQPVSKYNLEIILCDHCSLVQLKDIVPPQDLFDDYFYFSSHSDTMVQSAAQLSARMIPELPNDALVIEIASNDGYLLQHYIKNNIKVLGIEPAKNIAEHAIKNGIPTTCRYFSSELAMELTQKNIYADIIHANNVMAHVPQINSFVAGIQKILKPTGTAIIEVPYLLNLIDHCEFDTIYHEHVFYFSVLSLQTLFDRHDLMIADIEEIPIHGGSLRLFIKHKNSAVAQEIVQQIIANEKKLEIHQPEYYQSFSEKIFSLKNELLELLNIIKKQGKKIAAYGASAKGSTLLNFFGIGRELIDFVVDRSPIKQGHVIGGTKLPIYSPEKLLEQKPDYTLLLTWNFAAEILAQQQAYRASGGQFIIPIPELQVV